MLEKIKLKNKLTIGHRRPETLSDFIALTITKFLRLFADILVKNLQKIVNLF